MKNKVLIFGLILILLLQFSCNNSGKMSSYALKNKKIEESIDNSAIINSTLLDVIYNKAKSDGKYVKLKEKADKVHEISSIFNTYLQDLKTAIKDKNSTEFVDEYFFNGSQIARGGEEFLNYIESYKSSLISTIALSNPDISGMVKRTFDIGAIEDRRGVQTGWLTLNYKGFPPISSIIKLSEMQSDVKQVEKSFHESVLNVKLKTINNNDADLLRRKNQVAKNETSKETVEKVNAKEEKPVIKVEKTIEKTPVQVKTEEPKKEEVTTSNEVVTTDNVNSQNAKYHTVLKGETLYQISKKYNIPTTKIRKLNGMTNANLSLGQKLKLRN